MGQKQPFIGVLIKICSENQQIHRSTSMPQCDFNKVAKKIYLNHTSAGVCSIGLLYVFRTTFLNSKSGGLLLMGVSVENDFCSAISRRLVFYCLCKSTRSFALLTVSLPQSKHLPVQSTRKRCEICLKLTIKTSERTREALEKDVRYVQS